MELIDSHCHPHFDRYDQDRPEMLKRSYKKRVTRLIAVGCDLDDSHKAVSLAGSYKGIWATVGSHPHDSKNFLTNEHSTSKLKELLKKSKVVAVGEIGLDYYHEYSSKSDQAKALRLQIETGLEVGLPFVFHVRDAFSDFWKIFDSYATKNSPIKGVIHSFSAPPETLNEALARGLSVGLNGLLTYTKENSWRESAKMVPLERILLETDAPFLTPLPERGKRCEPRHTAITAEFLAKLRGESLIKLATATTQNTLKLFGLGEERME